MHKHSRANRTNYTHRGSYAHMNVNINKDKCSRHELLLLLSCDAAALSLKVHQLLFFQTASVVDMMLPALTLHATSILEAL